MMGSDSVRKRGEIDQQLLQNNSELQRLIFDVLTPKAACNLAKTNTFHFGHWITLKLELEETFRKLADNSGISGVRLRIDRFRLKQPIIILALFYR
tara:strand:+ start:4777 stop:5064 length:288 start_codon:yes stop_codon:yes gene_type:complete